MQVKATLACFFTQAALSRWIFIPLFIALMTLGSSYGVLLCLSCSLQL